MKVKICILIAIGQGRLWWALRWQIQTSWVCESEGFWLIGVIRERPYQGVAFWASRVFIGGESGLSRPGIERQVFWLGVQCLERRGSKDWLLGCSQIVDNLQGSAEEFWLYRAGGGEALRRQWGFVMNEMAWWKWYLRRVIHWEWGVCCLKKMRQEPGERKTSWKATILVQVIIFWARKRAVELKKIMTINICVVFA